MEPTCLNVSLHLADWQIQLHGSGAPPCVGHHVSKRQLLSVAIAQHRNGSCPARRLLPGYIINYRRTTYYNMRFIPSPNFMIRGGRGWRVTRTCWDERADHCCSSSRSTCKGITISIRRRWGGALSDSSHRATQQQGEKIVGRATWLCGHTRRHGVNTAGYTI